MIADQADDIRASVVHQERELLGGDGCGIRRVLGHPVRAHPDGLTDLSVVARRQRVHQHDDRDEHDDRRPDPPAAEVAAHDPRRDTRDQQRDERCVDEPEAAARQLQQGADPCWVTLATDLVGGPHRRAVAHDEQERRRDMDEDDPRVEIHETPSLCTSMAEPRIPLTSKRETSQPPWFAARRRSPMRPAIEAARAA